MAFHRFFFFTHKNQARQCLQNWPRLSGGFMFAQKQDANAETYVCKPGRKHKKLHFITSSFGRSSTDVFRNSFAWADVTSADIHHTPVVPLPELGCFATGCVRVRHEHCIKLFWVSIPWQTRWVLNLWKMRKMRSQFSTLECILRLICVFSLF